MQSNPIQQRIELICEKWEEAKKHMHARIVRIQCQQDELDMVDAFYTYMIGVDTPVMDIAFHFDSVCTDARAFSGMLLKELEEIIYIWNNSQKDDRIEYVPIRWKPDYSRENNKNFAALFVDNFNSLAKEMDLEKGLYAVAVFRTAFLKKDIILWLEHAIEANIHSAVKFLIHDTVPAPTFASLARDWPSMIATIPLNLDMPKAMEQVAAMGDPKDPGTAYRLAFMKMMNAIGAAKEDETEKLGQECIAIATECITRDPYWIMQVVVVNIALGNDKIRYKKKKETIAFANKAVEAATAAQAFFENDVAVGLLAQALMFRATVQYVQGNYTEALPDFKEAFEIYQKQGNIILAIEACRMSGKAAFKSSDETTGIHILAEGARLGKYMDTETARGSTYPGVLELLLKSHHNQIISLDEIDGIAGKLFGEEWMNDVFNWKQTPDQNELKQQEVEAAES